MTTEFLEQDCTLTLGGRTFSSGGAYLLPCTDGKYRGVVYVKSDGTITTWHGEKLAKAMLTDYRGNFSRMRRVSFTWNDMKFVGDYCPDWADACKVRTTKACKSTTKE